jgi:WS/DGAT/MGAT family acyltransferase
MKQLSAMDHMFLQLEHGHNYMHVAGLGIYDPSTAPAGAVRFKDILRFFSARIESFPHFRRRLVTVPFSLDRPYWVEDADFDVEFHVRHIALPHPGDWRQLCIQVARLHSRPLDRSKPLWEVYVIEGLHNVPGVPPGSFALYTKIHHSLIDGESGSEITRAIHSPSPEDADVDDGGGVTARVAERDPSALEIYTRALGNNLRKLPSLAGFSLATAGRLAGIGATQAWGVAGGAAAQFRDKLKALAGGDVTSWLPRLSPPTRFTRNVTSHRVFEAIGVPLAELKEIRRAVGDATINDLFMTIVGGALHKYLASKGELPATSIVAGVPMTLRGEDKTEEGNRIGFTLMPVHSEIADPIERLAAVSRDSAAAKRVTGAIGKDIVMQLVESLPAPVSQVLLGNVKTPKLGLLVSNVRGPDATLYMAGARLVVYTPISIVVDGIGLNCTGFSYAGTLCICAVSCREILPDPQFFATCLREAFDELTQAAGARAARDRAAVAHAHLETAEPIGREPARRGTRKRRPNGSRRAGRRANGDSARATH